MDVAVTAAPELDRRRLLAASDDLLDEVERLRLGDGGAIPERLNTAIVALQHRLGRPNPPVAPRTLKAAHELILAVQQRLMAANPRNPTTRAHTGRGSGQFVRTQLKPGVDWKLLSLPALPPSGADLDWLSLVEDTVERACDRWAWAQHLAVAAARDRHEAEPAWARAQAAWENYWDLRQEATELQRRGLRLALG
jgi:hypothetical protein